jgi:hypothetical protein
MSWKYCVVGVTVWRPYKASYRRARFPWDVSLTSLLSRVYAVNKFSLTSLLSRVYGQQVFLDNFTFSSCVRLTSFPWQVYRLSRVYAVNKFSWQVSFDKFCCSRVFGMLGNLSFTFPGTANGRFEVSWQNFRWTFAFHIFFLASKE